MLGMGMLVIRCYLSKHRRIALFWLLILLECWSRLRLTSTLHLLAGGGF
jgi:hypothetical protein